MAVHIEDGKFVYTTSSGDKIWLNTMREDATIEDAERYAASLEGRWAAERASPYHKRSFEVEIRFGEIKHIALLDLPGRTLIKPEDSSLPSEYRPLDERDIWAAVCVLYPFADEIRVDGKDKVA